MLFACVFYTVFQTAANGQGEQAIHLYKGRVMATLAT